MADEDLAAIVERVSRELMELESRARPLLARIERKRQELDLLTNALRVREGSDHPDTAGVPTYSAVMRRAIEILRSVGRPMTIAELHRSFRARGYEIPGRADTANLISHLRRCPDVVRVRRGVYGLSDWAQSD